MSLTTTASIETQQIEWLTRMEAVLEVLNEGVLITNDSQRILFVNSRILEMTGIPKQELIGSHVSHFYSEQEWQVVAGQIAVEFRDGRNCYTFVLPRKDGTRLPVIISARTVENCGRQFGIVTFTDISGRVRVEEELRSANARLHTRQIEIEEDLQLAARVQKSLAPKRLGWDGMSIDFFYDPVHSIGGDFALVDSQDQEQVSLLLCDVSGHGIGSALVANRIYSETMAHLRSGMPLTNMFAELNRFLLEDIAGSGMFLTAAAARIDAQGRTMVFAGAGHPPAMLARGGQDPLLLESQSMILGALPDDLDVATDVELQLQPDDRIIFYTDGISEVFDLQGRMLDIAGLRQIVRRASSLPAEEMKQGILDGVAAWRNGPPTDDVSLMVVHVR